MNETVVTVVGRVASDPSLRVTAGGARVASFRLASTERRYDKGVGGWRDGDTVFWTVSCWRNAAENVAESVAKGQPVLVHGRLRERGYEVDGQRRTSLEIDAAAVGHDLTRGVATFRRSTSRDAEHADGADVARPPDGDGADAAVAPVRPLAADQAAGTSADGSAA